MENFGFIGMILNNEVIKKRVIPVGLITKAINKRKEIFSICCKTLDSFHAKDFVFVNLERYIVSCYIKS